MSTPDPDDGLVIGVEALAESLGLDATDPTVAATIREAILGAQATVEGHLDRFIVPRQITDRGRYPRGAGWDVLLDDVREVLSATPETDPTGWPTGAYTLTLLVGLDVRTDERPSFAAVRRYIRAHALADPALVMLWQAADPSRTRQIKSLSAEGQSVSYGSLTPNGGEAPKAGSGAAGALPTLDSLDSLRLAGRRIFQRR